MKLKLGKRGQKLFDKYIEILDIPIELGKEIINRNWLAYIFITDEDCLSLGTTRENMNLLLKTTFFREDNDWSSLGEREYKILEEEYNIYQVREVLKISRRNKKYKYNI